MPSLLPPPQMSRNSWSQDDDKLSATTSSSLPGSSAYSQENMSEKRLNETQAVIVVESNNPPPPQQVAQATFPDGGTDAWLNIAGCTLICLTAFGQVNAFGVFQTYYATHQLASFSASDISWIGSIQILLLYLSGIVLGRVFDVYGARGLLSAGCLLSTFSMMMLSLSTQYYQIFLSQGVGLGLGIALQFYPLLVIPSHWFRRHRAIALGTVVAGSSLGGVVLPIMLSRLFVEIGFPWAVRTMGFLVFFLQAISIPLVRERHRVPKESLKKNAWLVVDFTALKDVRFVMHALSGFFTAFGLFTPFWYIELFMLSRGSSSNLAFYTVAIMNAAGAVGRITSGFFADRLGRFNTLIPVAVLQSVACFAVWMTAKGIPESIVFAVIFGFASASYSSVASSCVAQITADPSQIGSRTGMFMVAMAPGIFAGPPISGAILTLESKGAPNGEMRYGGLVAFCGSMLAAGAVCAVAGRWAVERKWRARV